MRSILHVDFDSFFASCEQHFNPNLRGKPIGITAENGRNCVIAASREAKAKGVKSPNTAWTAARICPEIVFLKADFERYLEITKKLLQIANRYSPVVELFSLDEVFIDLTPVLHLHTIHPRGGNDATPRGWEEKAILNVVQDFKQRLRDEIGPTITVSMGASYNKLLAKLATSINKPDGFAMIDKSNKDRVLSEIELTDIMGIGERYKRRLNILGIFNFRDLREYPMHLLKKEFGNVAAQNLAALSLGIDDSPVVSYAEDVETRQRRGSPSAAKSVGRNYCLPKNEYSHEKIQKTIHELCEEVAIKLRRLKMKGRTIGLYLHGNEQMGARKTIPRYTSSGKEIFEVCLKLLRKWSASDSPRGEADRPSRDGKLSYVRQVSIYVLNLINEQYVNPSLFENPKNDIIVRLVDQINDRFGHHTIRTGYLIDAPKLHTKPNGYMADRWHRKEIKGLEVSNHL